MKTAKIFQHGGSQAIRIPKEFRLPGREVLIERHGSDLVLRPLPRAPFETFGEIARHLAESFPEDDEFPAPPPRPGAHERPILEI